MKSLLWLFPFCFLSFQANAEWFVHSYKNCFEKDADKFLVQKKNIHKVNEGGGVTYWRATKANEVSTLVYKYNLSSIVKSAKIYGRVTTWGDKSIGGLFVSKDGQKWIPLKTFKNSANSEKFRKETIWSWVPVEALGGHSLFVRVTFAPPPSPLHVQFARASPDLPSNTDAYRIVIQTNGPALPEAPLPPNWKPIILGEPKPLMWIRHGKHLRKVLLQPDDKKPTTFTFEKGTRVVKDSIKTSQDLLKLFGQPDWSLDATETLNRDGAVIMELIWTRHESIDPLKNERYDRIGAFLLSDQILIKQNIGVWIVQFYNEKDR